MMNLSVKIESKPCSQCKTIQPLTEFHQYKSGPREGRYWSQCKSCRYSALREWRKENPEEYKRHYRAGRYAYKYGLKLDQLPGIGECPICLETKKLVVDHDHSGPSRSYRGFICSSCNTLLGHVENIEKLNRIKKYLNKEYL